MYVKNIISLRFSRQFLVLAVACLIATAAFAQELEANSIDVFNILGVLIWLPFIGFLSQMSTMVSPTYSELEGAARMAKEVPRQIANAHTIFNVVNTVLFIWFTGTLAKLVQRLVPEKEDVSLEIITPKFLSEELLQTPTLA